MSSSPKYSILKNRRGIHFIPCSRNLGYIGYTRRRLKAQVEEHRRKVKNEEIKTFFKKIPFHYFSLLVLQWLFSLYKSSPISSSILTFHEFVYILKNSNNLVSDFFSVPCICALTPGNGSFNLFFINLLTHSFIYLLFNLFMFCFSLF